jgi:hypothetical protein
MGKLSQAGIVAIILGGVITFIGLFPGVTGITPSDGLGILRILAILTGFSILIAGAYLFVQNMYYPGIKHNLAQQIGIRLSMTGLVIATAAGLADILGFGSHPPLPGVQRPFMGAYQTFGLVGGFLISSLGVVIFVLMGHAQDKHDKAE